MLSVYFVTDFITALKSAGSAARRVFAFGLLGELSAPRTVFLMWQEAQPPLFVFEVFMVNAPLVVVWLP